MVEHSALPNAELHPPKGAASATLNQQMFSDGAGDITWAAPDTHEPMGADSASLGNIYISDGANSGDWRMIPSGYCRYHNIATGTTVTAPVVYTLVAPVTVGGTILRDYSHNALGRLTSIGTETVSTYVTATVSFKHSTGANIDCLFQIHKNGVATAPEFVVTATNANFFHVTLSTEVSIATNDYVEVFCKASAGNIIVHSLTLKTGGNP